MTAPDPRLDEIQAIVANHSKSPGGIYGPGSDVAYLLAELRKAHEALGRVEALADELATQSDGRGLDYSDDDFDRGWHGANRSAVDQLRAAVAAAKETE